jgi:hypothetical protein
MESVTFHSSLERVLLFSPSLLLFCFVLFCFVLFCFVLFCFVLFWFGLFCFVLFTFLFLLRNFSVLSFLFRKDSEKRRRYRENRRDFSVFKRFCSIFLLKQRSFEGLFPFPETAKSTTAG